MIISVNVTPVMTPKIGQFFIMTQKGVQPLIQVWEGIAILMILSAFIGAAAVYQYYKFRERRDGLRKSKP